MKHLESIVFVDTENISKKELQESYLNQVSNRNVYKEEYTKYYVGYVKTNDCNSLDDDTVIDDDDDDDENSTRKPIDYNITPRLLSHEFVEEFCTNEEVIEL